MARVFCAASFLVVLSIAGASCRTDKSSASWAEQFKTGAATVKKEYGFTLWKGIDWDGRTKVALKEIAQAEAKQDEEALYWAVRRFTFIGDGHIGVADPGQHYQRSINGSYGLVVARDQAGRVLAVDVSPDGPAYNAGVRTGAEVHTWGGKPVSEALAGIPHWRYFLSAPTLEGQAYQQEMTLTRAPVGSLAEATFVNPDGRHVSANLTALDDGRMGLIRQLEFNWPFGGPIVSPIPNEFDGPDRGVQFDILTGPNVGYIKVMTEDTTKGNAPKLVKNAAKAVALFTQMGVRGAVIDLRGNNGGDDQPAADFVSLFYTGNVSRPYPYKDISVGTVKPPAEERKTPASAIPGLPFRGQLAVVTDHLCVSDCEGIAYALRDMIGTERTKYFSWDNSTMGAFGMVDMIEKIPMPRGNDVIQLMKRDNIPLQGRRFKIEANGAGYGGIPSDVMIPRTPDNLMQRYKGIDLPLQAAVRHLSNYPSGNWHPHA